MTNRYTEQAANLNSIAFALEHHGVDNRKEVKNFLVDLLEKSEHEYVYDIYFMYPDKHIPIIALSANAFEEDKQKSLEAGMDDHIAKTIVIEDLFSALSKFIG